MTRSSLFPSVSVNMNPIPELTSVPPSLPRATSSTSIHSNGNNAYSSSQRYSPPMPSRYSPTAGSYPSYASLGPQDYPYSQALPHPHQYHQQQQQIYPNQAQTNPYFPPVPTVPTFDPIAQWSSSIDNTPSFSDPFATTPEQQHVRTTRSRAATVPWNSPGFSATPGTGPRGGGGEGRGGATDGRSRARNQTANGEGVGAVGERSSPAGAVGSFGKGIW
jgi:hypothetical protein